MTPSGVSFGPSIALVTPLELLSLDHLLMHLFAIQMGNWGHAAVGSDVLWILGFVTIVLAFPILAIAIAILLALSFLLVVSRLVARLRGWELS